jgi:hypothetical protein
VAGSVCAGSARACRLERGGRPVLRAERGVAHATLGNLGSTLDRFLDKHDFRLRYRVHTKVDLLILEGSRPPPSRPDDGGAGLEIPARGGYYCLSHTCTESLSLIHASPRKAAGDGRGAASGFRREHGWMGGFKSKPRAGVMLTSDRAYAARRAGARLQRGVGCVAVRTPPLPGTMRGAGRLGRGTAGSSP